MKVEQVIILKKNTSNSYLIEDKKVIPSDELQKESKIRFTF